MKPPTLKPEPKSKPLNMPLQPLVPKEVEQRPIRHDPDFMKIYGPKGK